MDGIKTKGGNDNTFLAFATYLQIVLLMIQLLVFKLFFNGIPNSLFHIAVIAIAGLPMIKCATIWTRKCFFGFMGSYAICCLIFIIQYIFYPENRSFILTYTADFFFMCIPCFLNCLASDDDAHSYMFVKLSYIVLVLGEIYLIISLNASIEISDYSMAYSYYMLMPALSFVYLYHTRKKLIYLVLFLAPLVSMVLIGSRGAVISCTIYFTMAIILNKRAVPIKLLMVGAFMICIYCFKDIIKIANVIAIRLGVSSRTLQLLVTDELLSHDSGRSILWYKALAIIKKNWLTGGGIGADLRVLGIYSHNLFLDILIHFGVIIGGLIIVCIIVTIVFGAIRAKDKMFYLMLFCYGFLPAMVSGTYLSTTSAWVFFGYCIHSFTIKVNVFRWEKTHFSQMHIEESDHIYRC